MTHKFPVGEYPTRDGGVGIVVGHYKGRPVGIRKWPGGQETEWMWYEDGLTHHNGGISPSDLIPPNVITWGNLDSDGYHQPDYDTRQEADRSANKDRIAVTKWTHTPDGEFVSVELILLEDE